MSIPSTLRLAYADDLTKLKGMAINRIGRDAVAELEGLLQANKMPDQHLMSIFWAMIQRAHRVDRYGK